MHCEQINFKQMYKLSFMHKSLKVNISKLGAIVDIGLPVKNTEETVHPKRIEK